MVSKNKLSVNIKKSKFMLMGTQLAVSQMENVTVNIGDLSLERVSSYKYLGIKLDCHMKFNEHIQYIKEKTFAKIKLLGRLTWVLDRDTLHVLVLYKTLILPIIDYGDFIYLRMSQQDASSLPKLQNTTCHAILRSDIRTSISEMHDDLNVDIVYQRRCQHIAPHLFKFIQGLCPNSCNNLMVLVNDTHKATTRSALNLILHVPKTRL